MAPYHPCRIIIINFPCFLYIVLYYARGQEFSRFRVLRAKNENIRPCKNFSNPAYHTHRQAYNPLVPLIMT